MLQRRQQLKLLDEQQVKRLDRKIIPGTTAMTSTEQKKVLNRGSAKSGHSGDSDIENGSDEDNTAMQRLRQKLDLFFASQEVSTASEVARARARRVEAQKRLEEEEKHLQQGSGAGIKFLPLTRESLLKVQYLLAHPNERFEDDELRSDYQYTHSYDFQLRRQLEENKNVSHCRMAQC